MSNKAYNRPLQHKEYLKLKYLSGTADQESEKRRKKSLFRTATKHRKIRIVDDDVDLKRIGQNESDDELYYGTKEEKPLIAHVIDERPAHLKRKDIDTNRWKTIGSIDDEFDINDSPKRSQRLTEREDSDRDLSPPRHNVNRNSAKHNSDSDLSPPRLKTANNDNKSKVYSKHVKRRDSDSDLSPPRNATHTHKQTPKAHHSDHDLIAPKGETEKLRKSTKRHSNHNERHDSDSDLSPPRNSRKYDKPHDARDRSRSRSHSSKYNKEIASEKYNDNSRPNLSSRINENSSKQSKSSANERSAKTLSGKKSGVSDAKELHKELISLKKKEEKLFASISDDVLGKNAKTIVRDRKTGKIRDLDEEKKLKQIEDEAKAKIDSVKIEKYKKWSKGLVQDQQQRERVETDLYEMSKPLARYDDDADLDKMLREREREEDPMLETFRKKKAKNATKDGKDNDVNAKPTYKGPTPAPLNRFQILPGYRWDGVDRSNGFEKKYFERIANRGALIEESYKWSTQDM